MSLIEPSWMAELGRALSKLNDESKERRHPEWRLTEEPAAGVSLFGLGDQIYRLVDHELLGPELSLSLLGSYYGLECRKKSWPEPLQELLQREVNRARFALVSFRPSGGTHSPIPLATLMEDYRGDFHLLEGAWINEEAFWVALTALAQFLTERRVDHARYDDYGDFLALGAHSIVQRHSTERLRKHIAKRVLYDPKLCTQCMRCITACSEMRAVTGRGGTILLGPMEDYCTNCGLCQKRCSYLKARSKEDLKRSPGSEVRIDEGGAGLYLYGLHARLFMEELTHWENGKITYLPYRAKTELDVPDDLAAFFSVRKQTLLETKEAQEAIRGKPLLVTYLNESGADSAKAVIRGRHRAALLLQTQDGEVEREIAGAAMNLGMQVNAIVAPTDHGMSSPTNETAQFFYRMGHFRWASPRELWEKRETDLFLSPYADGVPADLHQSIIDETGRQAQVYSPHIFQALPITKNPLLMELNAQLAKVFVKHPELMEAEAEVARELLRDIPRNHALIHARYRHMAIASGHSACPTCAEVQVLALPVYMSIAMSLARGETPQVSFTCETGCMSETLNKVNEVAQKVPGGRTVFGGGFAFGEAITMVQDWAVRMGQVRKSRHYVVSQGGDGGAVIGLPAFLNALRQQAFQVRQRHPNALHFINITDTQVYSNTGGESSASSLLGLGTLTTPVGKFLMGNQKIQWTLINLAAEFPGILVGVGHSANKASMQQFWHMADQLGQSAIRWDVTPCPEAGKFFGEDPDDLAEVMAHAGMLPELIFVGRFRKRVAPFHPDDRSRPYTEWRKEPKPIEYWLHRDPRYRDLFRKNPRTGELEPRHMVAHFLISQLESFRDQLNWQIDLETRIVRQAEEWVASFFQELKGTWNHYRYHLEEFPHAMIFDGRGELKPEYRASLEQEMVRRVLGWEPVRQVAARRDQASDDLQDQLARIMDELERFEKSADQFRDLGHGVPEDFQETLSRISRLDQTLREELRTLKHSLAEAFPLDPVEEEIFPSHSPAEASPSVREVRRKALFKLLDRILEEGALARQMELQQYRLSQQLKRDFLDAGGLMRGKEAIETTVDRVKLREVIARSGPFSIGVASLAGDRGIAINRVFAQFFTAKGAWAGMAWQFGSSKRGTPVLSATFVDAKPLYRKDAMQSFPVAVLIVTNYEEMRQTPDLFFGQLRQGATLIINQRRSPETLWKELVEKYPGEIRLAVENLRRWISEKGSTSPGTQTDADRNDGVAKTAMAAVLNEAAKLLAQKPYVRLNEKEKRDARKIAAMASVRLISVDMDGIMQEVTGSSSVVSNLVAVGPIFRTLREMGLPFDWEKDAELLTQGFPEAVKKRKELLGWYREAMERAVLDSRVFSPDVRVGPQELQPIASPSDIREVSTEVSATGLPSRASGVVGSQDPGDHLMVMGGTIAGMVLSQIATAESPLFYIGFPITPAGNPFYFMAEAFANGHPYIVVDEVNPSEKVAAEKILGVARTGGFLPVTFTASQGWRLFTEIIPQFVGARLEGLFLITKRALAAPNLNIEESHTDFMSFRDDGGIMLAPKGIQEYVPSLYLARLLTHFVKLPVILAIGGITDTHKIGLVKVPPDQRVRAWLKKTLQGFDFLENKLLNRSGELIVHGPSGTSAVYQETQSEIEKAHKAFTRVLPYALQAVHELTGVWLDEIEVRKQGGDEVETLFILQGSLYPNAVEALSELQSDGWTGMVCLSIRCMNPFPEEKLTPWLRDAARVIVLDRSNSFGSVPPLASRVFAAFARMASHSPVGGRKPLRTLVGGLGGREVTVEQMKEILLSTHLLFRVPEAWEGPLISQWLEEDETLKAFLAEAASLDLRSTNRNTRVPSHLRPFEAEEAEYGDCLERLKGLLVSKDYAQFLQNYHQVEFLAPREVLQESVLFQQVVLYLEIRLARHAITTGTADWRRAMVLLRYGHESQDHERAKEILRKELEASTGPVRMAARELNMLDPSAPLHDRLSEREGQMDDDDGKSHEGAPGVPGGDHVARGSAHPVVFDPEEAGRIEKVLAEMVVMNGEKPLFFNPEDYEYDLLERMQQEPLSPLYHLSRRISPEEMDSSLWSYRCCYRDVIDSTLQREILTRHHAPELAGLFEGAGRRRLEELVNRLKDVFAEEGAEAGKAMIEEEVERYLMEQSFPHYPKTPAFYLDYFRNWVMPQLVEA